MVGLSIEHYCTYLFIEGVQDHMVRAASAFTADQSMTSCQSCSKVMKSLFDMLALKDVKEQLVQQI